MASKKKTVVEDVSIEETSTENIVEEVMEQVEETHVEETSNAVQKTVALTPLSICRRDLVNAIESNNLEWLIEIINKFNSDKALQEYDNFDYYEYFDLKDTVRINDCLLYYYRTFKYISDRETKIFNTVVGLADDTNDPKLYRECLKMISDLSIKPKQIYLQVLLNLSYRFDDFLNHEKITKLLEEK